MKNCDNGKGEHETVTNCINLHAADGGLQLLHVRSERVYLWLSASKLKASQVARWRIEEL